MFLYLAFATMLSAQPVDITGSFRIDLPASQVFHTQHVEVLWVASESQRQQLQELRNSGYSCQQRLRQFHRCHKNRVNAPVEVLQVGMQRRDLALQNFNIQIDATPLRYELVHESEAFNSYRVDRGIKVNGDFFDHFFWFQSEHVRRIEVRSDGRLVHSIGYDDVGLYLLSDFNVNQRSTGAHRDWYEIWFKSPLD